MLKHNSKLRGLYSSLHEYETPQTPRKPVKPRSIRLEPHIPNRVPINSIRSINYDLPLS